jgi:AAA+ ATPase superfamily predicted ATPase
MEYFRYGRPVTGRYFVDREKEMEKIYTILSEIPRGGGNNIALIGLRRTGKTSLLKNLKFDFEGVVPVFVDCYGIPSQAVLATQLADIAFRAYVEKTGDRAYGRKIERAIRQKASDVLSGVSEAELSVAQYASIKIGFREGADQLLEHALNYIEDLAREKEIYFVLMLDGFADVAIRWGVEWVKRLRRVIQHQERVFYILSSSAVTYMTELVYSKDSAFYRQLTPIKLGPFTANTVRDYVKQRLTIESEALDEYVRLTGCFPDYMQRLGYILMHKEKEVAITDIEECYEEMLCDLDPEFRELFGRLNEKSARYGEIIISLAGSSRPSAIAKNIGMSQSSLPKYLGYLMNVGIVEKKEGYHLTDSVFESWIERNFALFEPKK